MKRRSRDTVLRCGGSGYVCQSRSFSRFHVLSAERLMYSGISANSLRNQRFDLGSLLSLSAGHRFDNSNACRISHLPDVFSISSTSLRLGLHRQLRAVLIA